MFPLLLIMVPLTLSPFCDGFRPDPAHPQTLVDAGELIAGFHCKVPGYNSTCPEWFGKAPDIGACEHIPSTDPKPVAPSNLQVKIG